MKILLCLLICQCFTSLFAQSPSQPVWYAKYSERGEAAHNDGEAFFDMPVSKSEALIRGWVVAEINLHETVLCLPGDPHMGIIFGINGLVVGIDVGITIDCLTSPYKFKDNPEFFNITRLGVKLIVSRMYFVNPDVLLKGGRQELNGTVLSELWLKKTTGLINIPTNRADVEQTTLYKREECIPSMGRHYYFNMTVNLSCLNSKPWFLLFDDFTRELIGIGFAIFGNCGVQKWFERVPPEAVKITIPNGPDCLTNWTETYGAIAIHFWFKSEPWAISCNSSA